MHFMYDFPDGFFGDIFPQMYDTSGEFPGFVGSNHANANMRGPLKYSWSEGCPIDWTDEKRNQECISFQESIYGTKLLLDELEPIKKFFDPDSILACRQCVGSSSGAAAVASGAAAVNGMLLSVALAVFAPL